jgi:hypothetical protein
MVAHPRPNAEADYPRPIFAPLISPKINTRRKSKGRALFYHTRQAFSWTRGLALLAAEGFGKFRHVGDGFIDAILIQGMPV